MKSFFFTKYFITDPFEFGNTKEQLSINLTNSLKKHQVDMICFRDKESKKIEQLAKIFLDISKEFHIKKILINSNIQLALKLGFDGVHLTSKQFSEIEKAKRDNLYTIISCHSEDEIKLAKRLGSNAVTYSPIFYKEDKGEPKGIDELKDIIEKYQYEDFSIVALGGIITSSHIEQVKSTYAGGFASIRYFKN